MSRKAILVIEDEAAIAIFIQQALERLGYIVVGPVASGEEAWARFAAEPADLVLTEIRLRGAMDGIEAAALLRDRFGVPVVYMTADADEEALHRGGTTAPFGHLVKPFQEQDLQAALEMAFYRHRLEAAQRAANLELEGRVAERTAELQETTERLLAEVAERKRAEDALREASALNQQIIASAQEGVIVYDRDLRYRTWNPFMERLSGVAARDALGQRAPDLFPFLLEQGVIERVEKALAGETPPPIDFPYVLADGTSGWSMDSTSPLRDSEGRVVGAIGIVKPITERKQSEQEIRRLNEELEGRVADRTARLAEREAWLRAILASVPEAVVTIEDDGRVASFNAAAERTFEYAEAEVVGRNVSLLMPSPYREEHDGFLGRYRHTGEAHIIGTVREAEGQRRDGTVFPLEIWVRQMEHEGRRAFVATLRDVTEHKRIVESLRASEARYRLLFDRNLAGVYRSTLDGKIIECNDAFARIYGYESRAELEGRDAHELYPSPSVREDFITRLRQTGDLVNCVSPGRRKDGSEIWTLENVSLVDSEPPGVLEGTLVDVTERKRAEEELRESEMRFRSLAEAAFEGIGISEGGFVVDANPQVAAMLGYTVAEMIGRPVSDFIAPDSLAIVEERQRSGSEGLYEHYLRRKDGSVFPAEAHARAFPFHGRQLRVTALRDITERKRAEEEQARLSRAVAQAGESIVITDPEGTIVYVNPAFERITGYTRGEAVGQNPRILKSGRQDEAFYRGMWDTLVQGGVWSGRIVNRRKDGTLFDEDATIGPVRDASGRLVNYVAVKRDVSSEVLLQQQLQRSQKMDAVGRLAGGVAHDFNNLLFVITSYGEIVLRSLPAESPLRGKVTQILKAADRAAELTRQLLAFGRKQVLQPRTLDLNVIVSDMGSMLQRVIGENIKIVTRLQPLLANVRADPGQLEQVVMNLAVNARDAMPDGGRLVVETRNVHVAGDYAASHPPVAPGRYAMLALSDTGSGMTAETQAHIFEPFFTTKELGKGTGLGLSTVYGIVKQSGGYVWVYSEVGVGTTFKVYLPAVDEVTSNAEDESSGVALPRGSETVLVVEDEESVRDVLHQMLEGNGYRVKMARDGAEAFQIAGTHADAIHLLVTDVILPGMTGCDVVERVTATHPETKVLYISGYTEEAISRHGVVSPGTAFLSKPFGAAAFLLKIRDLLDRR